MDNPCHHLGFDFVLLHATELPDAWQFIEPGLAMAQKKARLNWDLMSISMDIAANLAKLTLLYHNKVFAGFVVTRSRFLGSEHWFQVVVPHVEIWCHQQGLDGVAAIDSFVVEYARGLHCKGLLEEYTREGWSRRLEKLGYKWASGTMIKEL